MKKLLIILGVVILVAVVVIIRTNQKPDYAQVTRVDKAKAAKCVELIQKGREFASKDDKSSIQSIMVKLDAIGGREFWENMKNLPEMRWDNSQAVSPKLTPEFIHVTIPGTNGQNYVFTILDKAGELKLQACRQ